MKDEYKAKPRAEAEPDPNRVEAIVKQVLEAYDRKNKGGRLVDEGAFIPDKLDRWDDRQLDAELSRLVTHPGHKAHLALSSQELTVIRARLRQALQEETE